MLASYYTPSAVSEGGYVAQDAMGEGPLGRAKLHRNTVPPLEPFSIDLQPLKVPAMWSSTQYEKQVESSIASEALALA